MLGVAPSCRRRFAQGVGRGLLDEGGLRRAGAAVSAPGASGSRLPALLPRAAAIVAYVLAHQAELERIGPFRIEISGGAPGAGELSFWLSALEKRRPVGAERAG
jgi:hypothetical protein